MTSSRGGNLGVYIVDTTGASLEKIMDVIPLWGPEKLAWSPDGSRIAMRFFNEIWTFDFADSSLHQWTNAGLYPDEPSWSPDGRYLLYVVTGRRYNEPDTVGGFHVLDIETGITHALTHDGGKPTGGGLARWSQDGQRIVFFDGEVGRDGTYYLDLRTIRPDGSDYHFIRRVVGAASNPQWLGASGTILFDYNPRSCPPNVDNNRTTYAIEEDGTGLRRWPLNLGDPRVFGGFPFEIYRDGRRITWIGLDSTGTMGVLWTGNVDGTDRRQVTTIIPWPAPGSMARGFGRERPSP